MTRPPDAADAADVLRSWYPTYLRVLDERRLEDLVDHVQPRLTYNGRDLTREDYVALLRADVAAIPDLTYDLDDLVVEDGRVAARLVFRCTPVGEFLGLSATGRRIEFAEHVFYRLVGGRIAAVTSMIDRDAVRRQLGDLGSEA